MNGRFLHYLQVSMAAHVLAAVVVFCGILFASCSLSRPPESREIVFTVDTMPTIEGDRMGEAAPPEPEPEQKPLPEPLREIRPEPEKKPAPQPEKGIVLTPDHKPDKKPTAGKAVPVEVNRTKVTRQAVQSPRRGHFNPLSAAEIRRLLALGATPGTQTVIPAEEDRCKLMVRNALYDAWEPPSKQDAGRAAALVRLWFADGGRILRWRLERASGVPVLDDSVNQVFDRVQDVPGLSVAFLREFRTKGFAVDFTVKEEGVQ